MVLPQLAQAEASNVWDYTTILDQLTRVYDNPNKVQEAEDKLLSIKQGTDSVPAYVAKFERVLYEASGQNWPDVNKISTFRNGLNSTIRSRLSQQLSLPRKYPDFVKVVQQLAGRSSHAPTSRNATNHHGEPMELGPIDINTIDAASPPQRARSISPTLRDQYRLQGRCVRCGSYDHWVNRCPLQCAIGKVVVAALDNDDDSTDGSLSPSVKDRQMLHLRVLDQVDRIVNSKA
jgi:hypothetical protein